MEEGVDWASAARLCVSAPPMSDNVTHRIHSDCFLFARVHGVILHSLTHPVCVRESGVSGAADRVGDVESRSARCDEAMQENKTRMDEW